jgi:hypothetical protein
MSITVTHTERRSAGLPCESEPESRTVCNKMTVVTRLSKSDDNQPVTDCDSDDAMSDEFTAVDDDDCFWSNGDLVENEPYVLTSELSISDEMHMQKHGRFETGRSFVEHLDSIANGCANPVSEEHQQELYDKLSPLYGGEANNYISLVTRLLREFEVVKKDCKLLIDKTKPSKLKLLLTLPDNYEPLPKFTQETLNMLELEGAHMIAESGFRKHYPPLDSYSYLDICLAEAARGGATGLSLPGNVTFAKRRDQSHTKFDWPDYSPPRDGRSHPPNERYHSGCGTLARVNRDGQKCPHGVYGFYETFRSFRDIRTNLTVANVRRLGVIILCSTHNIYPTLSNENINALIVEARADDYVGQRIYDLFGRDWLKVWLSIPLDCTVGTLKSTRLIQAFDLIKQKQPGVTLQLSFQVTEPLSTEYSIPNDTDENRVIRIKSRMLRKFPQPVIDVDMKARLLAKCKEFYDFTVARFDEIPNGLRAIARLQKGSSDIDSVDIIDASNAGYRSLLLSDSAEYLRLLTIYENLLVCEEFIAQSQDVRGAKTRLRRCAKMQRNGARCAFPAKPDSKLCGRHMR